MFPKYGSLNFSELCAANLGTIFRKHGTIGDFTPKFSNCLLNSRERGRGRDQKKIREGAGAGVPAAGGGGARLRHIRPQSSLVGSVCRCVFLVLSVHLIPSPKYSCPS